MGTEVLRPQNCLIERIRVPPTVFSRRKNYGGYCNYNNYVSNPRPSRKPVTRPERQDQRKRVRSSSDDSKMARGSGLVMEKVTILRRGQSLDSNMKSDALKMEGDDLVVCGTQRLGPDPEMVPKQIRIAKTDVYAGSAFAVSPSPSALPLPSFSKKKQSSAVVDDSATRDLRRLLRLE
ncbi:putative plant/F10N7-170 protein [Senna tora]|uniref:Putative plant/F10N7-170 protein n=1 Tax=Senna tora TaxID=362788 RepID=A0A834X2T9_9FABA|nr:putative plant/F10N7-170 protein [Senna tora]